jgi:hypothetical protein
MGTSGPTQGPGRTAAGGKNMSPQQGVQQAEQRLGKPCSHTGQKVPGICACVRILRKILVMLILSWMLSQIGRASCRERVLR